MTRAQWLKIRATPRNLWRRAGYPFFMGGTYVRPRKDPKENERLQRFAQICNANFRRKYEQQRSAL